MVKDTETFLQYHRVRLYIIAIFGYAAHVLYFGAYRAYRTQTLGERLLRIQVVDLGKDRLSTGRCLLREFLFYFPFYITTYLYISIHQRSELLDLIILWVICCCVYVFAYIPMLLGRCSLFDYISKVRVKWNP